MKKRIFWSLILGLCFAISAGLITSGAQAQGVSPGTSNGECQDCHDIIRASWGESSHAQAASDPIFFTAWEEAGSPAECMACHTTGFDPETMTWETEGVSCTVCHNPVPADHPNQIMPTDNSSRLCGECHLDTYAEWEISTHGQEELACVKCHDSHGAKLKTDAAQDLCQSCHNEEVHFFKYTPHFDQGLLCTDCHLNVSETEMGEGHGQRLHTFDVNMDACASCHVDQMHFPVDHASMVDVPSQSGLNLAVDGLIVTDESEPVSPVGFAVVAALVGMAAGMLLAPLLEKWYRRLTSVQDHEG